MKKFHPAQPVRRKACANDGKLFTPIRPNQKFCCEECRWEFHHNGGNAFGPLKTRLEKLVVRLVKERHGEFERRLELLTESVEMLRVGNFGGEAAATDRIPSGRMVPLSSDTANPKQYR